MIVRAVLVALAIACAPALAEYTVIVDLSQPDELTATLKLPKAEGGPHRLDVRGAAWGLHPQVHSATCGGVPLKQQKNGTWLAEPSCREVSWKVSPVVALDGSVDASKHATLLFKNPRWVLISEPTALLRLVDDTTGSASSVTIRTAAGTQPWGMSSANSAEVFVVGDAAVRSRTIGPFEVRYVADDPKRVEALGLEAQHAKVLEYLARVLPPPPALPASARTLLVVWVGLDERRGSSAGAAGNRSVVANYAVGKADARAVMTVAKAQFNQLAGMQQGKASQSLSEYYARKAALKALGVDALVKPDSGFWAAIDDALRVQSNGASDLDALATELVHPGAPGERLPAAFVNKLRSALGPQADALLAKYAGD